jgi:hypothetical protein
MAAAAEVAQPRHDVSRELASLIAGTEGQGVAALVDVETGHAQTLGDSTWLPSSVPGFDAAILPLLARALLGRGSSAEAERIAAACAAQGGVSSATLLLPEHDLLLSRQPGSSEALCLVVRHAPAAAAALDPVVHARSVHARLQSLRKLRALPAQEGAQPAAKRVSFLTRLITAWRGRLGAQVQAADRASAAPIAAEASPRLLHDACEADDRILAADLFDLRTTAQLASYRRAGCNIASPRSTVLAAEVAASFAGRLSLHSIAQHYGLAVGAPGKARLQVGRRDVYVLRVPYYPALRIPFAERQALILVKPPRGNPGLDWAAMDRVALNLLRLRIGGLLASGMTTQMSPFPANQTEFQAIVDRLAQLPQDDLVGRLDIGGFAARPVDLAGIEQRCAECIYYLPHRKWCDLPELPVPVEPQWWCRLWKL